VKQDKLNTESGSGNRFSELWCFDKSKGLHFVLSLLENNAIEGDSPVCIEDGVLLGLVRRVVLFESTVQNGR